MAEINLDQILREAGLMKMKPIPVEVEMSDGLVFVSWDAAELYEAAKTFDNAMLDFAESLVVLCGLLFRSELSGFLAELELESTDEVALDRIRPIVSEYIQPISTLGLMA